MKLLVILLFFSIISFGQNDRHWFPHFEDSIFHNKLYKIVKIVYHETFGKNWFSTRGETNHFVKSVDILDRNPVGSIFNGDKSNKSTNGNCDCKTNGKTIDTIYVVIDKTK